MMHWFSGRSVIRRLSCALLSMVIGFSAGPSGGAGWIVAEIAAVSAGMALVSAQAEAQTARRSGGYGRPSGGGGSFAAPSRRPSTSSGGYRAPAYSGPDYRSRAAPPVGGSGGGDRAISRQSAGQALRQYRAAQQPPPQPERRPSTGYGERAGSPVERRPSTGWGQGFRTPGYGAGYNQGYPAYVPTQRFGVWDGLLLWGLLNSLNQPGRSQFFHSNQDDPAYRQWRSQMDAAGAQDPSVRAKLADLDSRVAQLQGQPKTPNVLPPDVPSVPAGAASEGSSLGGNMVFIVLFLGGAVFVLLWFWRRRGAVAANAPTMPQAPAALGGSAETRFRVGMSFPVDPTPFVLAAVSTKVTGIDGERISVEAVGVLMDGDIPLHRLYLPGRAAFFQLHLGRDGVPDECRYFSRLDEVSPASQEEWGVWLDPAQGLIGWPQFQTKDAKTYDRVWASGETRVAPRELTETIQDLNATSQRALHAMLYGTPTGAPPPAPQTEYVLVAAIEEQGRAWVEIHAGIDINPASLTLPAVSLA